MLQTIKKMLHKEVPVRTEPKAGTISDIANAVRDGNTLIGTHIIDGKEVPLTLFCHYRNILFVFGIDSIGNLSFASCCGALNDTLEEDILRMAEMYETTRLMVNDRRFFEEKLANALSNTWDFLNAKTTN